MSAPALHMSADLHEALWRHLLPRDTGKEQAAFLYCAACRDSETLALEAIEAAFLTADDFAAQYSDYLELADATRAAVIKRAHELEACLAEFHSHPGPWPAAFSISDRMGLRETVPHMRWRLKRRPYIAVVVAPRDFDALIWTHETDEPGPLAGIRVGSVVHEPANASLEGWCDGF